MKRWFWKRWVWAVVVGTTAAVGLTVAQPRGTDAPPGVPKVGDVLTLPFKDGQTKQVKVLKTEKQPDGSYLSEVKDTKTGETFTLLDRPTDAPPSPGANKASPKVPDAPKPTDTSPPKAKPRTNDPLVPPVKDALPDFPRDGKANGMPAAKANAPAVPPPEERPGLLKRLFGRNKSSTPAQPSEATPTTATKPSYPPPIADSALHPSTRPVPGAITMPAPTQRATNEPPRSMPLQPVTPPAAVPPPVRLPTAPPVPPAVKPSNPPAVVPPTARPSNPPPALPAVPSTPVFPPASSTPVIPTAPEKPSNPPAVVPPMPSAPIAPPPAAIPVVPPPATSTPVVPPVPSAPVSPPSSSTPIPPAVPSTPVVPPATSPVVPPPSTPATPVVPPATTPPPLPVVPSAPSGPAVPVVPSVPPVSVPAPGGLPPIPPPPSGMSMAAPAAPVQPVTHVAMPTTPAVPAATTFVVPGDFSTPAGQAMMRDIQPHVAALQTGSFPSERALAARALSGGQHGTTDAVKAMLFQAAQNDRAALVRTVCIEELCKLGCHDPAFTAYLAKARDGDPSDDVKAAAKDAMAKMALRK